MFPTVIAIASHTYGASVQQSVSNWWISARPFFEEHFPTIVAQIDDDAARLERLGLVDKSFCVCVLGQSAVGKSTLLNAIVAGDKTILPAGGIGPLTALATEVRYSEEPYLLVTYRDRKQLSGFRLRLDNELKKRDRSYNPTPDGEDPAEFDASFDFLQNDAPNGHSTQVAEQSITAASASSEPSDSSLPELLKQVTQLITGDQFKELKLEQLVHGFRSVLGLKTDLSVELEEAYRENVRSAANTIASRNASAPTKYTKLELGPAFESILQAHISGHLAPLVEQIIVGYPASALSDQIVLVDLPGVGVANDRYRTITSEYVRRKASAVILVVDRAGPTDASVDLIRDSGYWDRLLLSSEDPERDPCELLIAVTRVDDVARQQYADQSHLPKERRVNTATLFEELRTNVRTNIRSQAESCFASLLNSPATDEDLVAARRNAQATLMKSLQVFPVSAIEYRNFLADDEDQHAFIKNSNASGIPSLIEHLESLATNNQERLVKAKDIVSTRIIRNVESALEQLTASWSTTSRAAEEVEKLRAELERFLEPKRLEVANRMGAYREFLDSAGTSRIAELVAKAQIAAQIEVTHYLRELRAVHWSTLRATVVRGGAHVSGRGLRVDLAADVAQRFQEPMAGIWGKTLLKDIRTRTLQHGLALQAIIGQICNWADQRSDTVVQREVLAAQQRLMKDRVQQLSQVGSEAVDDLKDSIKRDLMSTIEGPIRARCVAFRERGDAFGPGVKNRVLGLFEDLAAEAVAAAAGPATNLLQSQFIGVRNDIARALEDWGDPVQQASEAIVEREEQRRLRSDAQRRKTILAEIQDISSSVPKNVSGSYQENVA